MTDWTIGAVTLPYGPERIDIGKPAKTEDFELDGDEPIVHVLAPATMDLTFYGSIMGSDKSTVNSSYVSALLALRGTIVALADPATMYSGNYLFDVKFTDVSVGSTVKFDYVMTFRVVTSVNAL